MNEAKINKLFERVTSSKNIYEGTLLIENLSGNFTLCKEYNRTIDTPMLMASITKIFTTACILAMIQEEKLSLQDKISKFLSGETVKGLHVYKGQEYSFDLTIGNLLFQTSGLPDFYLNGPKSVFSKVKQFDFSFSFDDEIMWTKSMKPRFAPGTKNKAYYTDMNFDLLGKIIENLLDCPLQCAFEKYIFSPLGLKNTYLAVTDKDFVPHIYCKSQRLERPTFIRSCFASGSGITTARELMIFLKAFYCGMLFDKTIFTQLEASNSLQMSFYPLQYSGGYMSVNASYPFGKKVKLIGHSGSTGSFAFYAPEKDMFIVGDLVQMASPAAGVRLAMQAAISI